MTSDSKGAIAKVNTHGYSGANGRRDLLYSDTVGKTLWNSEYGDGDGTGMSLAANLALDFFWLHNTAYCYWQILDITKGWGLLKFNSSMEVEQANLKWWVFAQFTRHIRPGMTIIDSSESGTVAAYDADNMQLVIVTVNHDTARSVTYNLGNFQDVEGPVTRWTTTADGVDRYVERNDLTAEQDAVFNNVLNSSAGSQQPPEQPQQQPGEFENMGYDQNSTAQLSNLGYDQGAPTPGGPASMGAPTPYRDDDYYNPHSVASIRAAEEEQMQEDETIEEFEDRVLNKRAGHLNKILQSKFEENVILVDFKDLIRRNMRKQVAQKFYSILVLQKVEAVKINQDKPYDPIMVEKGPKFDISVI